MLSFIVFLLVLFVLSKYAWKPLLAAIEAREKRIEDALAAAELARVESEKLRRDFETQVRAARVEAEKAIEEGRATAEKFAREIQGKAREEADRLRERAKQEIDLARRQAIEDIRREAVDLAIQAASVVVRKSLNDQEHRRIAEEVVAEVGTGSLA
jgi:F-type H+-transporting ATPase subunit b